MAFEAQFVHDGEYIDYTPGSAVAAGAVVVQGELVGVAKGDMEANRLGALAVTGVFDFAKETSGGATFAVGVIAYWDATKKKATPTATGNKQIGKVVRAAAEADTTVRVRLSQ